MYVLLEIHTRPDLEISKRQGKTNNCCDFRSQEVPQLSENGTVLVMMGHYDQKQQWNLKR